MGKPFIIEVRGDEVVVLVWASVCETAPAATQAPVVIETTGEPVS